MIDALDQYLDRIIADDRQTLESAHHLCNEYVLSEQLLGHAEAVRKGRPVTRLGKDYSPNVTLALTHAQLQLATFTSHSILGESVKRMERHHPGLLAQYPQIPWNSYKQMRDQYAHAARTRDYDWGFSQKDWEAEIQDLLMLRNAADQLPTSPEFHDIHIGNQLVLALYGLLYPESPVIPLHGTPDATAAAKRAGFVNRPESLPYCTVDFFRAGLLNALNDRFNQLSPLATGAALGNNERETMRGLQLVRNYRMHDLVSLPFGEQVAQAEAQQDRGSKFGRKLKMQFDGTSLIHLTDPAMQNELRQRYRDELLGRAARFPEKIACMNGAVDWITTVSKNNGWLEQSFLRAFGKMLKETAPDQCRDVLDHLKTQVGPNIRKLQTLDARLAAAPIELQRPLKTLFKTHVANMETNPLKAGQNR